MFKQKIIKLLYILLGLLIVLIFWSFKQTMHLNRDSKNLMARYYKWAKHGNMDAAERALNLILTIDPNNQSALIEWKRLFVQKIPKIPIFSPPISAEIMPKINQSKKEDLNHPSVYNQLQLPSHKSLSRSLLESFYIELSSNKQKAWAIIQKKIQQTPRDVNALKEGGYLALQLHHLCAAKNYFKQAFLLTHDSNLAMQLAYLYDQLGNKPLAYRYFQYAAKSSNNPLSLQAQKSMTALAGLQTKAFPNPYYSEVFLTPFSESRFGLTVVPLLARLGILREDKLHTNAYLLFRRTSDNRSKNLGVISQIYEDDVQIMGAGLQLTLLKKLPIIAFTEVGEAYDLIYQQRNRWRGDVRAGFMYYKEFGAKHTYVDSLTFSTHYYGDLYADATYFSRYNNNVIGGIRTHQGIRLLQYHSSMVNLYATGRIIEDTKRLFYNNFAELGPGIALIPTNRWAIQIRLEHINGMYLPAGAVFNPYSKYYINNLIQLFLNVKI